LGWSRSDLCKGFSSEMMTEHTIDRIKMMNNYFMYHYGVMLCFGLIVTGLLPQTKDDKPSSTVKNGKI
jgi:hypothetical protein